MDRQPHNNLWAEKLLQVSMPDSGEAWAGMEAILDRRLPQRFWSDRRRWLLLILLLVLLIGVCNCPGRGRLFHLSGHGPRFTGARTVNPARTANSAKSANPEMPARATPAVPAAPASTPESPAATRSTVAAPPGTPSTQGATPAAPAATPANPGAPGPEPATPRHFRSGPLPPASVTARHNRPGSTGSTTRPNQPALAVTPSGRPAPAAPRGTSGPASPANTTSRPVRPAAARRTHKRNVTASHHPPRPATTPAAFGDITQTAPDGSSGAKTRTRPRPPAKGSGTRKIGTTATGDTATTAGNDTTRGNNAARDTATKKNVTAAGDTTLKKNLPAAGDMTAKKNLPAARDTTAKKRAPVLPKAAPRKDTLHKKPPPPPQVQDEKEKDHGWVFGIGLNQFFPIGGQRGSTYNSDGLTGTLSDYLPVPMIRYYLNHKAYLQVEAQLNTPQATKKNLVFNSPVYDSTSIAGQRIGVVTSATLQQLYYFNIPLSFHYAVTDDLNIGIGLQFSHLSNAIGNFDSTLTNLATLEVTNPKDTKSFKDDTLYRRIKTNEFRFLIDASYTWKHLVVGLRYNQALSRFINIQLPTGGSTQSRNSSLQLYLRYILWDTRKKKKQGPP